LSAPEGSLVVAGRVRNRVGGATGPRGAKVAYEEVEKSYGPVRALFPISLEVGSGEFFAILGPSGSGKTTLLGATAGFIPPSGGRILLNGQDVVGTPPFRRNIGMVFQQYSLFPHMTVAENIAFPLRMRKLPKTEVAARVREALEMVRLAGIGERRPNQLSGGQQQRVALARAVVYDPLLLLMDEPLGALDKNLREEMQVEIKRLQEALGTTVVYVTHDQHEAASLSHRIGIMNYGRLEQIGTPRDLYERPTNRFVASFLGEANLFEVEGHERDPAGGTTLWTRQGFTLRAGAPPPPGGKRFVACVRPENVTLGTDRTAADNCLAGTVADVVFTAGSVRYRVEVRPDLVLTQRQPSDRQRGLLERGCAVYLSWAACDTVLVAER
jgi:putative spermidine/putrescine transport system ATP-binding protein